MSVERSRIKLLAGGAAFAVTSRITSNTVAAPAPAVTVYKSPT